MGVTISAAINLKILDFNLSVSHAFVESPDSNVPSKSKTTISFIYFSIFGNSDKN